MNESSLHDVLLPYLSGDSSLQEFEDRFMPLLWDLADTDQDTPARELAGTIALLIAEYSRGVIAEPALKDRLAAAAGSLV